jgi:hypothetical protein
MVVRFVELGVPAIGRPQRVVSDEDDVLVSYWPIGTSYYGINFQSRETAVEDFRAGNITWGMKTWVMHEVLELVRPGDPYSILGFWNEEKRFVGWYANLQDPMRRTSIGYDSRDHALDVIIGEDLASWIWKDEHELTALVELNLFTQEKAAEIRANGEAVVDMVRNGQAWWGDWRDFEPDPSWPIPELPDGWDVLPT